MTASKLGMQGAGRVQRAFVAGPRQVATQVTQPAGRAVLAFPTWSGCPRLSARTPLLPPLRRNLGCANSACNLCKLSQRRRCPTNFAAKYLAPCDVVEAKCGAQIYVVVSDEASGQLVQQGLEDLAILVGIPGVWWSASATPASLTCGTVRCPAPC